MGFPLIEAVDGLLEWLGRGEDQQQILEGVVRWIRAESGAEQVVLVRFERGAWQTLVMDGLEEPLPYELLAETLDASEGSNVEVVTGPSWLAAAVPGAESIGYVLGVRGDSPASPAQKELWARLVAWLGRVMTVAARTGRLERRTARLEAMLTIAAQWGQTLEMDQLLEQMAEAATRLLQAERASIFLWDRSANTLVGRPALGVENGELRIPDDAGIVGQVVQTGEARRVDQLEADREIDRRVDRQTGFQTRNVLCVPLRGRAGELFGAFELINRRTGSFSQEDQGALEELATQAAVALENTQQYEQLLKTRNQMADQAAQGVQMIGQCPAIDALRSTIQRVAPTELAVLVLGENGTGKEVASRSIHYLSPRRHEPFVAVNCAALAETLLESELFGHEKGAFTDAREAHAGKFESANGGTLFLDEIGDMSLGGQAKLLRVLEEKIVVRVGGSLPIHTDVRVIAATNQNLAERVREKKFREDLYFRLNVVTLELPSLRARGDDILLLAEQFLGDFCRQAGRRPPRLAAAAKKRLLGHDWPGNVRELRNLMERIAYLSSADTVDADEVAFILSPRDEQGSWMPGDATLTEATRDFQAQFIRQQIDRARGNMTEAAERLGLHRANLYRKMRQLDMSE